MPNHPQPRTDALGRAFAGSQLQVQIAVARHQDELSMAVVSALGCSAATELEWVSPLEAEKFEEYLDAKFLHALGLDHLAPQLAEFWPKSGPRWDALARIQKNGQLDGVLLVEAKSYPNEVFGSGCQAKDLESKRLIKQSTSAAKTWYGVDTSTNWLGRLYQFANRLSHVYFMRQIAGIPAWLVNLCFVDDKSTHQSGHSSVYVKMAQAFNANRSRCCPANRLSA